MDSADQRAHVWLILAHAIADRHLLDLALQVFDQVVSDFITQTATEIAMQRSPALP